MFFTDVEAYSYIIIKCYCLEISSLSIISSYTKKYHFFRDSVKFYLPVTYNLS